MLNLDWTKITNEKDFHDLVNAVFRAEYGMRYTPGDPRRGADRGWDGGLTRLGPSKNPRPSDPPGVGMVQVKFTKKSGAGARTWLKNSLIGAPGKPGEIKKARDAGAHYLLLVTNAPLDVDHVADLRALSRRRRMPIHVFARGHLESLLDDKRWILATRFGMRLHPSLVPVDEIIDPIGRLGLSALPFRGREALVASIAENLMTRGVVLVHGSGGDGKSRLLRETAKRVGDTTEHRVLMSRRLSSATEILQNEINPRVQYIVVIDDAERAYEEDIQALARAAANQSNLRIILAARTGAHDELEKRIEQDGIMPAVIEAPAIDAAERRALITGGMDVDDAEAEDIDRQISGNLFLLACIVTAQAKTRDAAGFDPDSIKSHVDREVREQAKRTLVAAEAKWHRDLLPLLAAIAGASPDPKILAQVAARMDMGVAALAESIEVLVQAGILRRLGSQVRFDVDMVGDIVFERAFDSPTGSSFGAFIFDTLYSFAPDIIMTNVSSALDSPAARKHVSKVFESWSSQVRAGEVEELSAGSGP